MHKIFDYIKGDKVIWITVLFMALASILLVYSSVITLAYRYHDGNTFYYILKHSLFIISGFALIFFIHKINHRYFSRIGQLVFWASLPLLVLTLIIGTNINEASRWLTIPVINQSFQTSDLAKLGLILFLARLLTVNSGAVKIINKAFLPAIVATAAVCVLILPANFSTAAVVFISSLMLMFMAGVPLKHLSLIIPAGVLGLLLIFTTAKVAPEVFPRAETWTKRVERYISNEKADPNADYQVEQAKIAIATGGITGKGPGNSTQRNFLPHSSSDFIYAIVLEEYGLIGGLIILMFYMILLYRAIRIAQKTTHTFGAYVVLGLSFSLVFQGLINMAVNVNLLPVTGQPLPLVSMGGTSLWFTCISLGIILSVSRTIEETEDEEQAVEPQNQKVSHVAT